MQENASLTFSKKDFTPKKAVLTYLGCAALFSLLTAFALFCDTWVSGMFKGKVLSDFLDYVLTQGETHFLPISQILVRLLVALTCVIYIKRDSKSYRLGLAPSRESKLFIPSLIVAFIALFYVLIKMSWTQYTFTAIHSIVIVLSDMMFLALGVYLFRKSKAGRRARLWCPLVGYVVFYGIFLLGIWCTATVLREIAEYMVVDVSSRVELGTSNTLADFLHPLENMLKEGASKEELKNELFKILNSLKNGEQGYGDLIDKFDSINSVFLVFVDLEFGNVLFANFGFGWLNFLISIVAVPMFALPFYVFTNDLLTGSALAVLWNTMFWHLCNGKDSGISTKTFTTVGVWVCGGICLLAGLITIVLLLCKKHYPSDDRCEYEELEYYTPLSSSTSLEETRKSPMMLVLKIGSIVCFAYAVLSTLWNHVHEVSLNVLIFAEEYLTGVWYNRLGWWKFLLIHLAVAIVITLLVLFVRFFVKKDTRLDNAGAILGQSACWLLSAGVLALMITVPIVGLQKLIKVMPVSLWEWNVAWYPMMLRNLTPMWYTILMELVLTIVLVILVSTALSLRGVFNHSMQKNLPTVFFGIAVIGEAVLGGLLIAVAFLSFHLFDILITALGGLSLLLLAYFIRQHGWKAKSSI